MSKIILITGGQRSGKSRYAEELALSLADNPVYLATAHVWDQERRGPQWTNIEEEKFLSRNDLTGRVAVIDCVTLWLTNFFFENQNHDTQQVLDMVKAEFDRFTAQDATFIFVTNEIGSGGTSENVILTARVTADGDGNESNDWSEELPIQVSGVVTGIDSILARFGQNAQVYTLDGKKVDLSSGMLKKGLYIINGKKTAIK